MSYWTKRRKIKKNVKNHFRDISVENDHIVSEQNIDHGEHLSENIHASAERDSGVSENSHSCNIQNDFFW